MQQVISELMKGSFGEVRLDEPLAPYTTWKIGGPADVLLIPENKTQLVAAVKLLHQHRVPWTALGRGSNMLVADKGIRGVVIKLGDALETVRIEGESIVAGGAYSFIKLSVIAGKEGLTGLEFAGGIPGTVGGAVYMNAGAHGSDVSRILQRLKCCSRGVSWLRCKTRTWHMLIDIRFCKRTRASSRRRNSGSVMATGRKLRRRWLLQGPPVANAAAAAGLRGQCLPESGRPSRGAADRRSGPERPACRRRRSLALARQFHRQHRAGDSLRRAHLGRTSQRNGPYPIRSNSRT